MIIKSLDSFDKMIDEIIGIINSKENPTSLRFRNREYWDNIDLSPSSSNIDQKAKLMWHLRRAKNNDFLEKIHSYPEPLAVRIDAEDVSGLFHTCTYNIIIFDLSTIKQIHHDMLPITMNMTNEYEILTYACSLHHESIGKFEKYIAQKLETWQN